VFRADTLAIASASKQQCSTPVEVESSRCPDSRKARVVRRADDRLAPAGGRVGRPLASGVVPRSAPIDGFSLAYDRAGAGPPVVLLHGWPGTRGDFRALVPMLVDAMDVIVPDLRGLGESDKHAVAPRDGYSAAAQARSVVGVMDELSLTESWSRVMTSAVGLRRRSLRAPRSGCGRSCSPRRCPASAIGC
jgi:hypothetical protein